VELDSSVFLDLPLDGSGNHNAPHNSNHLEPQLMTGGRWKCVVWASFALAALFVAGAKFYISNQVINFQQPALAQVMYAINQHLANFTFISCVTVYMLYSWQCITTAYH
jgi:hypothetical protein